MTLSAQLLWKDCIFNVNSFILQLRWKGQVQMEAMQISYE